MGLMSWLKGEKVLYYPGCLTKGVLTENLENYKEIFNRLGIDFVMLSDDEVCCGLPVMNAGYKKDVKKLAEKNLKLFKDKGVTRIVTNCPSCLHVFNDVYPKLVRDWDIEATHATVEILNGLKRRGIKWKGESLKRDDSGEPERELVAYHDPCHLGRYSKIYDEPREVVEMLGGRIVESRFTREKALCCGGGGGVRANFAELAKKVGKQRVKSFDKDVKKIISPCGLCYANLKSASDKSVEFSGFVLGKLRGMR
ncbi:(Fe-S)-binding protein [Methanococcoides sp. SA1]|nr:(Fe-S)-binding protein [Methanococcoides sp. SA1]